MPDKVKTIAAEANYERADFPGYYSWHVPVWIPVLLQYRGACPGSWTSRLLL